MHAQTFLVGTAITVLAIGCGKGNGEGDPALDRPSPGAPGRFAAEVVSVDAKASRIVLRDPSASGAGASAEERRLGVGGAATALLPQLQPGDAVVVACDDTPSEVKSPGAASARPGPKSGFGPAGGSIGVGPIATGDDLASCGTVVSLIRIARPKK